MALSGEMKAFYGTLSPDEDSYGVDLPYDNPAPNTRRPFSWKTLTGVGLVVTAMFGTAGYVYSSQPSPVMPGNNNLANEIMNLKIDSTLKKRMIAIAAAKPMYATMTDDEKRTIFEDFKLQNGRKYDTTTGEEDTRFSIFKENLDFIDRLNRANPLASYGITTFADFTEDERKRLRHQAEYSDYDTMKNGLPAEIRDNLPDPSKLRPSTDQTSMSNLRKSNRKLAEDEEEDATSDSSSKSESQGEVGWVTADDCAACNRFPHFADYTFDNMPTNFDWRALGAVTEVKNQKYCGSCWTFSTAQDIEGTRYLAGDDLVNLSEQQLVACDDNKGMTEGCNGGYPYAAMQYIAEFGGLVTDESYPYKGICAWDSCDYPEIYEGTPVCDKSVLNGAMEDEDVAHIGAWQMVSMGSDYEDLMGLALLKNGPISTVLNANGMEYYIHGVTGCPVEEFGAEYCEAGAIESDITCEPTYLDHAVLLVGYGEQDGVDYWLIKNSWGEEWGQDGYYRIVRGQNYCGIANFAVHSVVKSPTA